MVEQSVCLTKWHQCIFSVSVKFGTYYVMGQWVEFMRKMLLNAFFCFFLLLLYFVVVVFQHKICVFIISFIFLRVLLNRAPTSTQLYLPPPSSIHLHPVHFNLHPAYFSFHSALCNTLNNIWTKILHVIGQFPQI